MSRCEPWDFPGPCRFVLLTRSARFDSIRFSSLVAMGFSICAPLSFAHPISPDLAFSAADYSLPPPSPSSSFRPLRSLLLLPFAWLLTSRTNTIHTPIHRICGKSDLCLSFPRLVPPGRFGFCLIAIRHSRCTSNHLTPMPQHLRL